MQKIVVAVAVIEDEKLLVVKEADEKHYGKYNLPSGHVDQNESIFKAAIREVKEETGYEVVLKNILTIHNLVSNDKQVLVIIFKGERLRGEKRFDKKEILDVEWLSIKELEEKSVDDIRAIPGIKATMLHSTIEKIKSKKLYPLAIIEEYLN